MDRLRAAVVGALRRAPDWSIYSAILLGLAGLCMGLGQTADAPPTHHGAAPGSSGSADAPLLGPVTAFDPEVIVEAPERAFQPTSGTAFSIADRGRWVTARHVVEGCRRPAVLVGGGRAVAAAFRLAPHADLALLITDGGPAGLPLAPRAPQAGGVAFHPGYPQARAGEVSSRLLGEDLIRSPGRGRTSERVLAWAEMGRTRGMEGSLSGLSGAPALDDMGRVVGVTIAEAPRRGRIYTTTSEALAQAVRGQTTAGSGGRITLATYGRASDDLRRELRVAQVVCLS